MSVREHASAQILQLPVPVFVSHPSPVNLSLCSPCSTPPDTAFFHVSPRGCNEPFLPLKGSCTEQQCMTVCYTNVWFADVV